MKKILISQKDINAIRSGVPKLILSHLEALNKTDITPYVIAERILEAPIKELNGNPVKTFRWPFSGLYRRKFYQKRVSKFIKKYKPELIIGHGDIISQDICFIHNCVHLAYELIHGKQIPSDHEVGQIHDEILTKKDFKLLVCNSNMMKQDLIKRYDLSDKEIIVHYPNFNADKFLKSKISTLHNELNIEAETITLGLITSGNFKKRNVQLLLESLKKVSPQHNLHIIIAGKDKSEPFHQLIQELPFPVSFLPPTDEVEKYFQTLDIFILPAHIEEFGISVLEAMACKKPVILGPHVGASELLTDKSSEFILNSLSAKELAEKIETLITNQELRKELGELNHTIACQHSNQNEKEKFFELLNLVNFKV